MNDVLYEYISETMYSNENHKTEDEWDKIHPIYHDHRRFRKIMQKYIGNFF